MLLSTSFVDSNLCRLLQLFLFSEAIHFNHLPFNAAQAVDYL